MKIPRTLQHLCFLAVFAMSIGCNRETSGEKSARTDSEKVEPSDTGAGDRKTERIDLSDFDLFVTLDAPAGAQVREIVGGDDGVVVDAPRFTLMIIQDENPAQIKKHTTEMQEIIRQDGDTMIYKHAETGIQFTTTISLADRDYWCYSQDSMIAVGLEEEYTLEEIEFMLKCAQSLAIATVDGKPYENPHPQTIPAGYPPDDPSNVEIAIDDQWIHIGGYRVREGKTKSEELDQLLGEPDSVVELGTNQLFFYEQVGIRYYQSIKFSKYIGAFDIYLNFDPANDEYRHLDPEKTYPGKLLIKGTEIGGNTTTEDLLKLGFERQRDDYVFELDRIDIRIFIVEGQNKIESVRVGEALRIPKPKVVK